MHIVLSVVKLLSWWMPCHWPKWLCAKVFMRFVAQISQLIFLKVLFLTRFDRSTEEPLRHWKVSSLHYTIKIIVLRYQCSVDMNPITIVWKVIIINQWCIMFNSYHENSEFFYWVSCPAHRHTTMGSIYPYLFLYKMFSLQIKLPLKCLKMYGAGKYPPLTCFFFAPETLRYG